MVIRKNSLLSNNFHSIMLDFDDLRSKLEDFGEAIGDHMIEFHKLKDLEDHLKELEEIEKSFEKLKKENKRLKDHIIFLEKQIITQNEELKTFRRDLFR